MMNTVIVLLECKTGGNGMSENGNAQPWGDRTRMWQTSAYQSAVQGNISYRKGRGYEYRVKEKLKAAGWVVTRSFGSFGPYDLHASRGQETWLIQCKWSKAHDTKPEQHDLAKLITIARMSGLRPVFAGVRNHKMYFVDLVNNFELELP